MIHYKQKKKSYVSPEIDIMECDEEQHLMAGSNVTASGDDQDPEGEWGNAKAGLRSGTDFEYEDDLEDDFNYQTYRKEMLW